MRKRTVIGFVAKIVYKGWTFDLAVLLGLLLVILSRKVSSKRLVSICNSLRLKQLPVQSPNKTADLLNFCNLNSIRVKCSLICNRESTFVDSL
jgi:hypothetical protein